MGTFDVILFSVLLLFVAWVCARAYFGILTKFIIPIIMPQMFEELLSLQCRGTILVDVLIPNGYGCLLSECCLTQMMSRSPAGQSRCLPLVGSSWWGNMASNIKDTTFVCIVLQNLMPKSDVTARGTQSTLTVHGVWQWVWPVVKSSPVK